MTTLLRHCRQWNVISIEKSKESYYLKIIYLYLSAFAGNGVIHVFQKLQVQVQQETGICWRLISMSYDKAAHLLSCAS